MRKIRWGILSTAKIGRVKVIPALQAGRYSEVVAIASRDIEKARSLATELKISEFYGSYEELLADATIDAIYNPLPNHLHVPLSIQALEAGKHVLCEKPIALSYAEACKLAAAAAQYPHLKLMEAFMYRFHPQWQKAQGIVRAGEIGELKTIHSFFSYYNVDPENVRNQADIGGGALLDIGCYCVSLSRFLFDAEPQRVLGLIDYDPVFKTDRFATVILEFERGTASFTCATQLNYFQRVQILGTHGRVEIEIPFNAPPDKPCRLWFQKGDRTEEILTEISNQYILQGDFFSLAILQDRPVPTPINDALQNMCVLEAIFESHRKQTWIRV
ncbi:Gfo/Idh/MocA family oxidoreductase [candidate division KSB1 bacterium]|nr:Gfo/Idh/MocA family oxidoreductase [candidate division KSB1 bacterium]